MIKVWVVTIGDEILSAEIRDTNSYYLVNRLSALGMDVKRVLFLPDDPEEIKKTFKRGVREADIVISSGGLGPTPDDHTKPVAIEIFKTPLIMDKNLLERIEKRFLSKGRKIPELAKEQALVPRGAMVLDNPVGMAPGFVFEKGSHSLILLPGVPEELRAVFEKGTIAFLRKNYRLREKLSLIIKTTGIAEAEIYHKIKGLERGIRIAYLPSPIGVDVKIVAKSRRLLLKTRRDITRRLKPYIYGYGEDRIEETIGRILRKKGLTLATAESCTGGLLGDLITSIAGSSDYFIGGVIAYSNKIKKLVCGVKEETLKSSGAVSSQTAKEMANGIRKRFKTNIGVSISGIAGPEGGTKDKPVGLVYIGISYKRRTYGVKNQFYGTRDMIKTQSAIAALELIRREMSD